MLDILNRYLHGYVAVPVIVSCHKRKVFSLLKEAGSVSLSEFAKQIQANEGYLQIAMNMFEALGWVTKSDTGLYTLTLSDEAYQALLKMPLNIGNLYHLPVAQLLEKQKYRDELVKWLDFIANNQSNTLTSDLIAGAVIVPLVLALRLNYYDVTVSEQILSFLVSQRWWDMQNNRLTEAGQFMLERAYNLALAVSYAPMLNQMDELIFGNPKKVFKRDFFGHELHIDRNLNISSSAFQHERYFADIEEILLLIFNKTPLKEQPRYIIDMGCGDGSLLKKIYEIISTKTERGKEINRYPLHMIGVDFNKKALRAAEKTLANIPHYTLQGNISDPKQLILDLKKLGIKDLEKSLHVRSFLDHDRPYVPPKNLAAIHKHALIKYSSAYVNDEGKQISSAELVQSLVEHLVRWRDIITDFGIIILEVHCLPPKVISEHFEQSESFYFDALQFFSKQYPVTADTFLISAAEAGLFPKVDYSKRYPQAFPFTRITLNYFEKRPYQLAYAQMTDMDKLLELEQECWDEPLRISKTEIMRRIQQYPQGQFVIKDTTGIIAVIYTQRISSTALLSQATFKDVSKLHTEEGKILQLIGINLRHSMQGQGIGDKILEFILFWATLLGGIEKMVGVSRCKNYLQRSELTLQEYVNEHITHPGGIDPILRFHTSHGAQITKIIDNYRPADQHNLAAGILVEYDIYHLHKISPLPAAVKNDSQMAADVNTSILELLPEKYRNNYSEDIPLREMGFDSLRLLELRTLLNTTLATKLDPTFFFQHNTPRAMIEYLKQNVSLAPKPNIQIKSDDDAIAIIGIGCRFPGAVKNPEEFWKLLKTGTDAVTAVPPDRWQSSSHPTINHGGFLENVASFDADFFHISPREAELMDPQQRILLEVSWEALENAGLPPDKLKGSKTGVFIGVFSHDYETLIEKNVKSEELDAYFGTGNSESVLAGRISYSLGLQGPALAVNTACSSSLVSVHLACQSLLQNESDLALAAGVNLILLPDLSLSFVKAGMLSPDGRCKTFDESANGYVRSEGCGVLILKKLSNAIANHDQILAVIRSTVINQDGASNGLTAPNEISQEMLLRKAIEKSHLSASDISYIETHGTGTALGDPIEVKALTAVYSVNRGKNNPLWLGSVKTNIGHTEGAAGVASIIKTVLALQHKEIPANLHFHKMNPFINPENVKLNIPTKTNIWEKRNGTPRRAGVSSFGFSGTNAHIILEEAPKTGDTSNKPSPYYLVTLSAKTTAALKNKIKDLEKFLKTNKATLADISFTLNHGRTHFIKRCAMVVKNKEELIVSLKKIITDKNDRNVFLSGESKSNITSTAIFKEVFKNLARDLNNLAAISDSDYRDKLMVLANFYTEGYELDWHQINKEGSGKLISLPVYPFEKNKYWIQQATAADFTVSLTGKEFYLKDHQLNNTMTLPGVVYIEFVNQAVRSKYPQQRVARIKNLIWLRPIQIKNNDDIITIDISKDNQFQITSNQGLHAQGKIFLIPQYEKINEKISLADIQQRGLISNNQTNFYSLFTKYGLNIGPTLQVIQECIKNNNELLLKISLPDALQTSFKDYILHPAILDGAAQAACFAISEKYNKLYLPFSIGEVHIYAQLPKNCYAYLVIKSDSQQNPALDIVITDENGNVVVKILNFMVREYQSGLAQEKTSPVSYYYPAWKQQDLQFEPAINTNDEINILNSIDEFPIEISKSIIIKHEKPITDPALDLQNIFNKLVSLIKYIISKKINYDVHLLLVNYHQNTEDALLTPALQGLAKTISLEYPKIKFHIIETREFNNEVLRNELNSQDLMVRYDKNQVRWIQVWHKLKLTNAKIPTLIKPQGVYLITGGASGLGLIIARFLAEKYRLTLVLIGRSPVNDKIQNIIEQLKQTTDHVIYLSADVANYSELQQAIVECNNQFGTINGIIHCAGVTRDAFVINKTEKQISEVFSAKIKGTLNLDSLTQTEPLDFFVMFSSITSVLGNVGQIDYAFANGFLDAFSEYRENMRSKNQRSGKSIAINWPLWEAGGMKIGAESKEWLKDNFGMEILSTQNGLEAFETVLQQQYSQQLVFIGDNDKLEKKLGIIHRLESGTLLEKVQNTIVTMLSKLLKTETSKIHTDRSLSQYGVDSIILTNLANQLNRYYELELTPAILFEHTTISSFAQFLVNTYPNILSAKHNTQPITTEQTQSVAKIKLPESAQDIAIIGMQGVFPQSPDLAIFWNNLKNQKDLITEVPKSRWHWQEYYGDLENDKTKVKSAGFVEDIDKFDAKFFNISPREAELMDPQQRIFLEVVWKTIEDAGYNIDDLAGNKIGLFVGIATNDYIEIIHKAKDTSAYVLTGNYYSVLANRVSYLLNFTGPSVPLDTACSSSLVAIHEAVKAIQTGDCEMAIAGGVNALLVPSTFIEFDKGGMLAEDGHSKTFDKSANGYARGEGAGAILLKPLDKALADKNTIYGVIKGTAINHGGHVNSLTVPNPNAQADLIQQAVQRAQIDINTITYVETHGTGTKLGDPIEVNGLKRAFQGLQQLQNLSPPQMPYCGLGSVKTNMGHLEAAAGIAGVIKVLLAMKYGQLPGLVNFKELNPYIEIKQTPFYIVDKTQEWVRLKNNTGQDIPYRAGVSSFGFGGANAHVILEEGKYISADSTNKPAYLITLSANSPFSLAQKLVDLEKWLLINDKAILEDISFTLNKGRKHFEYRCAMVVGSLAELKNTLHLVNQKQFPRNYYDGKIISAEAIPAEATGLDQLAMAYVKGDKLDWDPLHKNESQRRISLPSYPFEKKRYWLGENSMISKPEIKPTDTSQLEQTELYLKKILSPIVKIPVEEWQSTTAFEKYGIDSVMIVNLNRVLEKTFGNLPKTLFFEYQTLQELAGYFIDNYSKVLTVPSTQQEKTSEIPKIHHDDTNDIAIIGMSGHYPEADNLEIFWENLKQGKDSIKEIPQERWDYETYFNLDKNASGKTYSKWGSFIDNADKFDPLFFNITPSEAEIMDPQERLFLQTAWETIEDAGYTHSMLAKKNIGVFVGVMYGEYQLMSMDALAQQKNQVAYSSFSSIANRVSYFINSHGPSIALDTMCSSSLTAIHLACQSILTGESEMAIAGGVNLSIHPLKYLFLSQGRFLSTDGHCRSFGEGGDGYVPGEGVGAIMLKPLKKAVEDGDHIYGVIKASSINHGGKTHGYTVPNPIAQAELLNKTYQKANIKANTVNYIEAHGTGTSLGDPIEIRALSKLFDKTTNKHSIALGSVKSNLGHLESAAGIVAVTKVLLQLANKQIVPSLHSNILNSNIDFNQSPFYLVHEVIDWNKIDNLPRRAGISSFGAGGSNAHIILEEAPVREPTSINYPYYIFTLSAKTDEGLKEYLIKIEDWLSQHKQEPNIMSDLTYTLNVCREHFEKRYAVICSNVDELQSALLQVIHQNTALKNPIEQPFSQDEYKNKLLEIQQLYLTGKDIEWDKLYKKRQHKISLPTYPFAKEHYWITDQVIKKGLSSNISYVREHIVNNNLILAGTAYLALVYQSIQSKIGKNVTGFSNVTWITPLIIENNHDVNIELEEDNNELSFKFYSKDNSVLHCEGKAMFHEIPTPETIDLNKIKQRCHHNTTREVLYNQLTKMGFDYSGSFKSVNSILSNNDESLAELILSDQDKNQDNKLVLNPGLIDGALSAIYGIYFASGKPISLHVPFSLDSMTIFNTIPSHFFAYAKPDLRTLDDPIKLFDVTLCDSNGKIIILIKGLSTRRKEFHPTNDILLYHPEWLEVGHVTKINKVKQLLAFTHKKIDTNNNEHNIIWVHPGSKFNKINNNEYQINIINFEDYKLLFADLEENKITIDGIIHAWNINPGRVLDQIEYINNMSIVSLFAIFKNLLLQNISNNLPVVFAFNNIQPEAVSILESSSGLFHSLKLINPNIQAVSFQIEDNIDANQCWNLILNELNNKEFAKHTEIKYVNGSRLARQMQYIDPSKDANFESALIKKNGVYLITGGLGKLGRIFADYLASRFQASLVLIGRKPINSEINEYLNQLKNQGSHALYLAADVCQYQSVQSALEVTQQNFGHLDGIIHAAGSVSTVTLQETSLNDFNKILLPKFLGLNYLDKLTQHEKLDFFIVFSSVSSELGDYGSGSYATANRYMDSYVFYREKLRKLGLRSGKSLAINWPLWQQGGMELPEEAKYIYYDYSGFRSLDVTTGLKIFNQTLNLSYPQIFAAAGEKVKIDRVLGAKPSATIPLMASTEKHVKNDSVLLAETEKYLKNTLSSITKIPIDKISAQQPLENYGIDSVMILKFNKLLAKDIVHLRKTLLFEYRTLEKLAHYLIQNHSNDLKNILNITNISTQASAITQPAEKEKVAVDKPKLSAGVAVIGISGRYPHADDLEQFWENLRSGQDCIETIPTERWDYKLYFSPVKSSDKTYSKWGGFISDADKFDPGFFNISAHEAVLMDPQERLLLEYAWSAIEDAGYNPFSLMNKEYHTGVFVGLMWNEYQLLGTETNKISSLYGNSNTSSLANRISYFLNLNGPSMSIDTACSSSLVAIHLACEHILHGGGEYAIACGVNLSLHPSKYVNLSQLNMLASDGKCRSFGEGGDGYVPGEGVGVVLLKSLDRAIADGDHIYGVIIGSAMNHGGKTHGYTVPNPEAQADVIAQAIKNSKAEPATISYIEAHGTGTSLGDPIEMTGLDKALNVHDMQYKCPIGSVKANIGHLEGAAGIVALTKILLQLKYRMLVPSIHAENLNSNIDFSQVPFYVQRNLAEWKPVANYPLRAGISSFGAGGTNAHLIVEEAPALTEPMHANKPYYLFTLSAKSDYSLKKMIADLSKALTGLPIEDISFTLNTGRMHFEKRCAIVAATINELKIGLQNLMEEKPAANVFINLEHIEHQEDEAIFKKLFKQLCKDITNYQDADEYRDNLLALANFYIKGYDLPWETLHQNESKHRLSLPTYPFQRKRYWIKTKNEVASLYDEMALEKKATISQDQLFLTFGPLDNIVPGFSWSRALISGTYPNVVMNAQKAMRAILFRRVDFNQSKKILDIGCGYASDLIQLATHYPHLQLTGYSISKEQIDQANRKIAEKNLSDRITLYNRDSVTDTFPDQYDVVLGLEVVCHIKNKQELFANISQHMPDKASLLMADFISNTAFDIDYEQIGSHLITASEWSEVLAANQLLVLECIDQTQEVANFLQDPDFDKNIATLEASQLKTALQSFNQLGKLLNEKLVSYVLLAVAKRSDLSKQQLLRLNKESLLHTVPYHEISHLEDWFYTVEWKEEALLPAKEKLLGSLVVGEKQLAEKLANKLPHPVVAIYGEKFIKKDENHYILNPTKKNDWEKLLREINLDKISNCVLMSEITPNFLPFAQALFTIQTIQFPIFYFITQNDDLHQYTLSAMTKVLMAENDIIDARVVDLDDQYSDEEAVEAIINVMGANRKLAEVGLRGKTLRVPYLTPVAVKIPPNPSLKKWGKGDFTSCLITGGLGGLGMKIMEWYAQQGVKHFILLGRHQPSTATQTKLQQLKNSGIEVVTRQVDVTKLNDLAKIFTEIKQTMPPLRYVIHAAGVINHIMISEQTETSFNNVMAAKTIGAWNLHLLTQEMQLDHFVLFSSIAAIFGFPGQVHYAAASAFLDRLAQYRQQHHLPALSINWGVWADIGMSAAADNLEIVNQLRRKGFYEMSVSQGLEAFGAAVGIDQANIIISPIKIPSFSKKGATRRPSTVTTATTPFLKKGGREDLYNTLRQYLSEITGNELAEIKDYMSFEELGLDSVMAISLRNRIQTVLGDQIKLAPSMILEYPTIKSLAEYINDKLSAKPIELTTSLSLGQQRMYFAYKLDPTIPSYNCSITLNFSDEFNLEILKQSCQELVERHQELRAVFVLNENNIVSQIIPTNEFLFDFKVLSATNDELDDLIKQQTYELFNLAKTPLIRFAVIETVPDQHFIMMIAHHIVIDGVSFHILTRELYELYRAKLNHQTPPLPKLTTEYIDYISWQHHWLNSDEAKTHLAYWQNELAQVPLLHLPTDKTRKSAARHNMKNYSLKLSQTMTKKLEKFVKSHHVNQFDVLLTAYGLLLSKYTQQNDFVIGILQAGRTLPEFENVVGFFLNILPLRIKLNKKLSFVELAMQIKNKYLESLKFQDVPIEKILAEFTKVRETGGNPLFQTCFIYQNFNSNDHYYNANGGITHDDIDFEIRPAKKRIELIFKYNTDIFLKSTVKKMAEDYLTILDKELTSSKSIVLAATFTSEPLQESIQFWMNKLNLPLEIKFAPYNQLLQELLNPTSHFNKNNSGANIALVRLEDWLSQSFSYPQLTQVVEELISSIKTYANSATAPLFVHICAPSPQFLAKFMEKSQYDQIEKNIEHALKDLKGVYFIPQNKNYIVRDYYNAITDASAHVPYTPLYFTALGTIFSRNIFNLLSRPYKVIVLDGDNTLWQGILGEEGIQNVKMTPPYMYLQKFMLDQRNAGMLLCICSKNNESDVVGFFAQHRETPLRQAHFTSWRINWQPKSAGIKQLADELNLGLDSFIFVDDNIVECAEVQTHCPQVLTLSLPTDPEKIPQFLNNVWIFDHLSITAADRERAQLYQENIKREKFRHQTKNFHEFIDSLNLEMTITPINDNDIARVAQLTQRTNQFNMTNIRKTEMDLHSETCLVISVKDRFGSYGLVGVVFYRIQANQFIVENFLLSCRVLGKGIEHKVIAELGRIAEENHCEMIIIHYRSTERNIPAKLFLELLPAKQQHGDYHLTTGDAMNFKFVSIAEEQHRTQHHEIEKSVTALASEEIQEIANQFNSAFSILEKIQSKPIIQRTMKASPKKASLDFQVANTETEQQISTVFCKLLNIDRVSVEDNFFDLGATSLLIVQAQAELYQLLHFEIPLLEFFNHPTIRRLAEFLTGEDKPQTASKKRAETMLLARKKKKR